MKLVIIFGAGAVGINYRLVSHDEEIPFANYIKIDNSHLKPNVVAGMIKERFAL